MIHDEKDLLLQDLCARLPYGVKVDIPDLFISTKTNVEVLNEIFCGDDGEFRCNGSGMLIKHVKPYLFPLSSMTEEQRIELYKALGCGYESHYHLSKEWEDFNDSIDNNGLFIPATWVSDINKMYNWLNKNHFDYRGLIPMGLAIDATGLNIY